MKKHLIFISFLFFSISVMAQDTLSKYIDEIRKEFVDINSKLKNFNKIDYLYTTKYDSTNYTVYYNYGQMVMMIAEKNSKGAYEKDHAYYKKNGELIFVFQELTDGEGIQYQKRYYFYDNDLIRVLTKKREKAEKLTFDKIANKPVSYNKEQYEGMKHQIWNKISELRKKYELRTVFPKTDDKQRRIDLIDKEYTKILSQKSNYEKKTATFTMEYDPDKGQMEYWSVTYTGYFNSKKQLSLLTFSLYDHGYDSDYEYYFKDEQNILMIKTNDYERDNEKSIEKFYIYNGVGLPAFFKLKTYNDQTPFSKIKFGRDNAHKYVDYIPIERHKDSFFSALFGDE